MRFYATLKNTINHRRRDALRVLTPIDVALQMRSYAMSSVVELQVQPESQQRWVLFHQLRDLHLDFVAQHL